MSRVSHQFREVRIAGAVARVFVNPDAPRVKPRIIGKIIDATPQFRAVRDAADVDKELGNPGDQHHCPICNEYFGWEAFKTHASACIEARMPRTRIWTPPGMLVNPVQHYPDQIKMGD